jgi:integrase
MPNNRPGQGTVVQRRDGRWQASLQVNGVRRTVYGRTEREAHTKLRELRRQADTDGALPMPGKRTVADLIDAWLTGAPNLKPTTVARHRYFFDTYARDVLGRMRLERVTPDQLQRLYAGLTPSVASNVHRLLHRAFAVAVLWRWVSANPCDRVLPPVYTPARRELWSRDELQTFLDGTAEHWLQPLWRLLLGTGLRLGEALALTWNDVGLGVAVTVSGTLQRLDGAPVVTTPKTPSSARTVIVPSEVTAALQRQKAQQDAWREAAAGDWHESDFVFTGTQGNPLWASTVEHALKRECARLGLPAVTPHGLRHLHASLLLNEGLPVTAVSARLGHANPAITLKVYAHALAGQDAQAAQAIGRALAPATPVENAHEVRAIRPE